MHVIAGIGLVVLPILLGAVLILLGRLSRRKHVELSAAGQSNTMADRYAGSRRGDFKSTVRLYFASSLPAPYACVSNFLAALVILSVCSLLGWLVFKILSMP